MSALRVTLFILASCLFILSGCSGKKAAGLDSFGSETLLHTLWFDEQLAGANSDVARATLADPDLRPPLRTRPVHVLPQVPPALQQVIVRVVPENGRKVMALTFDLCERAPHLAGYQKDIVNYLRSKV